MRQQSGEKIGKYSRLTIFFCDEQPEIRMTFKNTLRLEGFGTVEAFDNYGTMFKAMARGLPDIVIASADADNGKAFSFLNAVRVRDLGKNPFIPVIYTTWNDQQDWLRRLVNLGSDNIVAKPLSIKSLMSRIDAMIEQKRCYFSTHGYLGPDRRNQVDFVAGVQQNSRSSYDAKAQTVSFNLPNILRARIRGAQADLIQNAIEQAWQQAEQCRDISKIYELEHLVTSLQKSFEEEGLDEEEEALLNKVDKLTDDIIDGFKNTRSDVAGIARIIQHLARQMCKNRYDVGPNEITMLSLAGQGASKAIWDKTVTATTTGKLARDVGKFAEMQYGPAH